MCVRVIIMYNFVIGSQSIYDIDITLWIPRNSNFRIVIFETNGSLHGNRSLQWLLVVAMVKDRCHGNESLRNHRYFRHTFSCCFLDGRWKGKTKACSMLKKKYINPKNIYTYKYTIYTHFFKIIFLFDPKVKKTRRAMTSSEHMHIYYSWISKRKNIFKSLKNDNTYMRHG